MAIGARRGLWGTRFGFYLAAIGSAFGLGNIWRFPYITVENGGGAFVFLYIIIALVIGLPILIGELMLGKITRRSVFKAIERIGNGSPVGSTSANTGGAIIGTGSGATSAAGRAYRWAGVPSVLANLLVLAYYAVISGWVLHFLSQFFIGHLFAGGYEAASSLRVLRENGWLQVLLASVHLLIAVVIVAKGVQEGMEKWVSNAMPVFVLLLVILVTKSLSLPAAGDAIRFMLYPDFTKLTRYSLLQAMGHVFFTLSVGFGTMVTFGSYLNERTHIPSAGFRVTSMDTIISLFAGLLIFPLLIGPLIPAASPELVFEALPRLLAGLDNGFLFGLAFFVCLYLAALGASIGMLEVLVSNVLDMTKLSRTKASAITGVVCCLLAILPALSTSTLGFVQWHGRGLLSILDAIIVTALLPLSALAISLAIVKGLKATDVQPEFVNDDSIATRKLYSHWVFSLKWLVPGVTFVAFGLAVWGLLAG